MLEQKNELVSDVLPDELTFICKMLNVVKKISRVNIVSR